MKKQFWKSKTFWGAVIAAVPVPGAALISAAVVAIPETATTQVSGDPVVVIIQGVISILGAVLVIYGRHKASGQLAIK